MRLRGLVAVGAGVAGAALAHVLDEAALLPGVHEAAGVRSAMGPGLTVGWLALAGALAWLAARVGPLRIGAPSALVVAALPELVGRHDLGAIVEPGALAGAALQWLLLLAVLCAVVILGSRRFVVLLPLYGAIEWPSLAGADQRLAGHAHVHRVRSRAPPLDTSLPMSTREEGHDRTKPRVPRCARNSHEPCRAAVRLRRV